MTTVQIDISCNGDECGECGHFNTNGLGKAYCGLFQGYPSGDYLVGSKRCHACISAERRAKGE